MAKQKPKPKTSWSKRMTGLPHGKRVAARLGNEITRLANTLKTIESWPDDEHDIGKLKKDVENSLSWLRHALTSAEKIPDTFKPTVRRPQRKLEVGDTVTITKRYFADYGFKASPACKVLEFVGKRIRVRVVNDSSVLIVPRGHVTFSQGGADE